MPLDLAGTTTPTRRHPPRRPAGSTPPTRARPDRALTRVDPTPVATCAACPLRLPVRAAYAASEDPRDGWCARLHRLVHSRQPCAVVKESNR